MKKLVTILIASINIFFCSDGIAAFRSDTIPLNKNTALYDLYLKKSKDQKKLSAILSISGGLIGTTGMILGVSQLSGFMDPKAKHHDYGSAPEILSACGIALVLAAIPITLESRKNKKRSDLYLHPEVSEIKSITQKPIVYTGMRVSISF